MRKSLDFDYGLSFRQVFMNRHSNEAVSWSNIVGRLAVMLFLLTFILCPRPLNAQYLFNDKALGIGINMIGPTLGPGSVFMQYGIGKSLQAEVGAGLTAIYGGISLFPIKRNLIHTISPYMSLIFGYTDPAITNEKYGLYVYMPLGMRYIADENWVFSVEIAASTASNIRWGPIYPGIKIGYIFTRK